MKLSIVGTVAVLALAGCAQSGGSYQAATAPAPVVKAPAAKAYAAKPAKVRTTARGTFVGDSDHITTGTAEVFKDATGWKVRLGPDFSLDGAPDPKVALGNGGYIQGTTLGHLNSLTGEQVYAIPASLDIGDYKQIWIWCEKFSVPLGHAELTLL